MFCNDSKYRKYCYLNPVFLYVFLLLKISHRTPSSLFHNEIDTAFKLFQYYHHYFKEMRKKTMNVTSDYHCESELIPEGKIAKNGVTCKDEKHVKSEQIRDL